jgi:hypothetical protein
VLMEPTANSRQIGSKARGQYKSGSDRWRG